MQQAEYRNINCDSSGRAVRGCSMSFQKCAQPRGSNRTRSSSRMAARAGNSAHARPWRSRSSCFKCYSRYPYIFVRALNASTFVVHVQLHVVLSPMGRFCGTLISGRHTEPSNRLEIFAGELARSTTTDLAACAFDVGAALAVTSLHPKSLQSSWMLQRSG